MVYGYVARRDWIVTIVIGFAVGVTVASIMAFFDWRLNPGRIFHSDNGTDWHIVWQTWISWFIPVCVGAFVIVVPLACWFARRR